jgi:hypothetical protein
LPRDCYGWINQLGAILDRTTANLLAKTLEVRGASRTLDALAIAFEVRVLKDTVGLAVVDFPLLVVKPPKVGDGEAEGAFEAAAEDGGAALT